MKNQGCHVRYYHDMIGYNYRLEGIQGAVLSVSLKYLPEWTARRREIGKQYLREIYNPLIIHQAHPDNTDPVFHLFVIQVENPEHFLTYTSLGYHEGDCPNAEKLAKHCITLPLFPEMTADEVQLVIDACNDYTGE